MPFFAPSVSRPSATTGADHPPIHGALLARAFGAPERLTVPFQGAGEVAGATLLPQTDFDGAFTRLPQMDGGERDLGGVRVATEFCDEYGGGAKEFSVEEEVGLALDGAV